MTFRDNLVIENDHGIRGLKGGDTELKIDIKVVCVLELVYHFDV